MQPGDVGPAYIDPVLLCVRFISVLRVVPFPTSSYSRQLEAQSQVAPMAREALPCGKASMTVVASHRPLVACARGDQRKPR